MPDRRPEQLVALERVVELAVVVVHLEGEAHPLDGDLKRLGRGGKARGDAARSTTLPSRRCHAWTTTGSRIDLEGAVSTLRSAPSLSSLRRRGSRNGHGGCTSTSSNYRPSTWTSIRNERWRRLRRRARASTRGAGGAGDPDPIARTALTAATVATPATTPRRPRDRGRPHLSLCHAFELALLAAGPARAPGRVRRCLPRRPIPRRPPLPGPPRSHHRMLALGPQSSSPPAPTL